MSKAVIHETAVVHPTAVIYDGVVIEAGVKIGPFCIVGAPAEKRGAEHGCGVIICSGTVIHGAATIDGGYETPTYIGEDCYIMKQVHIGHDALIGRSVTIAPHATIGGHCVIQRGVGIGMNASIHQFVEVADGCFIGQGSVLPRGFKTMPNRKYVGVGRDIGENRRL